MKKICFVMMGNLYTAPYLDAYAKHISGAYSVIFWDREGRRETSDRHTYYRYDENMDNVSRIGKIAAFSRYKKYVERVLSREKFDIVILLQTWCALLVSKLLIKQYSGKFVVDVRDYTYEKNPIVKGIEKRVFKHALKVVVSSKGFLEFLPEGEYLVAHNIRTLDREKVRRIQNREKEKKRLKIAFIGVISYQEQQKKLIKLLGNDPRFEMSFIGTRALELRDYCDSLQISNVELIDTFDAGKILDFYEDVDFVNNLYGNHTPILDYALSNKLYFAAELHIPILVCPDTYMETLACAKGFGLTFDFDDSDMGSKLLNYYNGINWETLSGRCDSFMEEAATEHRQFEDYMSRLLG